MLGMLFFLAVAVLALVSIWKVFVKAGQPGWASIIPIYNVYVLVQIAGKPGWWVLLYLIPIVNIAISFIVMLEVVKKFGQGVGFTLGLVFLPFIFWPMLAFGDYQYSGPPPLT